MPAFEPLRPTSTLTLLLLLTLLLFALAPTSAHPATDNEANANHATHLTKRHPYTLICRTRDSLGQLQDDIPLSRRCTRAPHNYRCDALGNPDVGTGGRTDQECDRKCECRDVSTDPKPRCVELGGMGGWHICDVRSGL